MQELIHLDRKPLQIKEIDTRNTITISEIFLTVQGEGLLTGVPTVFIRTAECNLFCKWCDSLYAKKPGIPYEVGEIIEEIKQKYPLIKNICLTGGEPLIQPNIVELLKTLEVAGYKTTVETSGSVSVRNLLNLRNTNFVVDIKAPSSGMEEFNQLSDISILRSQDSIKIVCKDYADFNYAVEILRQKRTNANIIFSPCWDMKNKADLVNWLLNEDSLRRMYVKENNKIRIGVQIHKIFWEGDTTGEKERTANKKDYTIKTSLLPVTSKNNGK